MECIHTYINSSTYMYAQTQVSNICCKHSIALTLNSRYFKNLHMKTSFEVNCTTNIHTCICTNICIYCHLSAFVPHYAQITVFTLHLMRKQNPLQPSVRPNDAPLSNGDADKRCLIRQPHQQQQQQRQRCGYLCTYRKRASGKIISTLQ